MSDEAKGKIKEPKKLKIRAIETRGESSLVEWAEKGALHRGYVQTDSIDGDRCPAETLAHALPVGPNPMLTDLHKLTEQLRSRGVWTRADFRQKANSVIRSLLEAMEV
jgi:hypothetical protein